MDLGGVTKLAGLAMFPQIALSTAFGAGDTLAGLYEGKQNREAAEQAQLLNQLQFKEQMQMSREQMAMQREFAQMGIRWKVHDAQKAGLHPLAALGANTMSFNPVSVGNAPYHEAIPQGQDISRGIQSMWTMAERVLALKQSKESHDVLIEGERLRNAKLVRELQNSPVLPTGNPSGVSTGQAGVNQVPAEQVISGRVGVEKAPRPMQMMTIDDNGRVYFPLGSAAEESLENDIFERSKYLGARLVDVTAAVGTGILKGISPYAKYLPAIKRRDEAVKLKADYIARELGVSTSDVVYNTWTDSYRVKKDALKHINRR
jgi:hypothetical protein